jgi:hypothetical protein
MYQTTQFHIPEENNLTLIKIYKTIALPTVFHGHETKSLTQKVFENRVLRRILGSKSELTEGVQKLYTELYNLHSSHIFSRVIKLL